MVKTRKNPSKKICRFKMKLLISAICSIVKIKKDKSLSIQLAKPMVEVLTIKLDNEEAALAKKKESFNRSFNMEVEEAP